MLRKNVDKLYCEKMLQNNVWKNVAKITNNTLGLKKYTYVFITYRLILEEERKILLILAFAS